MSLIYTSLIVFHFVSLTCWLAKFQFIDIIWYTLHFSNQDKAYRDMEAMYRKLNNQLDCHQQHTGNNGQVEKQVIHSDVATMGTSFPSKVRIVKK